MKQKSNKRFILSLALMLVMAILALPPSSWCSCETEEIIIPNKYTGACGYTQSSSFTLDKDTYATRIGIWYDTNIGGNTLSVNLSGTNGYSNNGGKTTKGSCQWSWCEGIWSINQTLKAGTYTLTANSKSICANPSGQTTLTIYGCAADNSTTLNLTDGLVAYYPFNGNANDESGNGNNGAVNGAVLTKDGLGNPNSAYSFDGVNDYISVAYNASKPIFNLENKFTYSLWFYANSSGDLTNNQPLIGRQQCQNAFPSAELDLLKSEIAFTLNYQNSATHSQFIPLQTITPNQWTHIAATYDKDTNQVSVYLNGKNILSESYSQTIWKPETSFWIGGIPKPDNYSSCWETFLNGNIDNIRVYNRSLSQSEIEEIYNSEEVNVSGIDPPKGGSVVDFTSKSSTAPVYMGSVVTGGDQMELSINFPAYNKAVDVWVLITTPDGKSYFLDKSANFFPIESGKSVPMLKNISGVKSEKQIIKPFDVTSLGSLLDGKWTVYWFIAPSNNGDIVKAIEKGDYQLGFYTFEIKNSSSNSEVTQDIGISGGSISLAGLNLNIPKSTFSSSTKISIEKSAISSGTDELSDTYTIKGLPYSIGKEMVLDIESKSALNSASSDSYYIWFEFEVNNVVGINYITYSNHVLKANIVGNNTLRVTIPMIDFQAIIEQENRKSYRKNINDDGLTLRVKAVELIPLSTEHFVASIKQSDQAFAKKTLQYLEEAYAKLGGSVDSGGLGFNWLLNNCRINTNTFQYEKIPVVFKDGGPAGDLGCYNPGLLSLLSSKLSPPCYVNMFSAELEFNTNSEAIGDDDKKLKGTAAHELFHFLQEIYTRDTLTETWGEASSMWIESYFANNCPGEAISSFNFTYNGLFNVYNTAIDLTPDKSKQRWHGYGASSFFVYAISKGAFKISSFWEGLNKGIGEVASLKQAISSSGSNLTLEELWLGFSAEVYSVPDKNKINKCLPSPTNYRWSKDKIYKLSDFPVTFSFDAYPFSSHSNALILKGFNTSEKDIGIYVYANGLIDGQDLYVYHIEKKDLGFTTELLGSINKDNKIAYIQNFENYNNQQKQQSPIVMVFVDKNIPAGTNPSTSAQAKTNTVDVYVGQGPYLISLSPYMIQKGKELSIDGFGYGKNGSDIAINFNGSVTAKPTSWTTSSTPGFEIGNLKVNVPQGASAGDVTLQVEGRKSNALKLIISSCSLEEGKMFTSLNTVRVSFKDCNNYNTITADIPLTFSLGSNGTIIPKKEWTPYGWELKSLSGSWNCNTINLTFTVELTYNNPWFISCRDSSCNAVLTFTGNATLTADANGDITKSGKTATGKVSQQYNNSYESKTSCETSFSSN
ncbi:MAG: LamG domain-containing protein [Desulfamplus sp.]|nr:LamG domain-containing protein [Desulfamplus sp.]